MTFLLDSLSSLHLPINNFFFRILHLLCFFPLCFSDSCAIDLSCMVLRCSLRLFILTFFVLSFLELKQIGKKKPQNKPESIKRKVDQQ